MIVEATVKVHINNQTHNGLPLVELDMSEVGEVLISEGIIPEEYRDCVGEERDLTLEKYACEFVNLRMIHGLVDQILWEYEIELGTSRV